MKSLLIGFLAFALTLGVACKKESVEVKSTAKTEKVIDSKAIEKPNTLNGEAGGGGYPGGGNTYPHNTGACYCGVYASCHPAGTLHYPDRIHAPIAGYCSGWDGSSNGTNWSCIPY